MELDLSATGSDLVDKSFTGGQFLNRSVISPKLEERLPNLMFDLSRRIQLVRGIKPKSGIATQNTLQPVTVAAAQFQFRPVAQK